MNNSSLKTVMLISSVMLLTSCSQYVTYEFKQSNAGKGLLQCVSSTGELQIKPYNSETPGAYSVVTTLIKMNKTINLQFEFKPDIRQAQLISANVNGKQISKLELMIDLGFLCGDVTTKAVMPDESRLLGVFY